MRLEKILRKLKRKLLGYENLGVYLGKGKLEIQKKSKEGWILTLYNSRGNKIREFKISEEDYRTAVENFLTQHYLH